jgi:hypothetical protein
MVAAEGKFPLSLFVMYGLWAWVDSLDSSWNQVEIHASHLEPVLAG